MFSAAPSHDNSLWNTLFHRIAKSLWKNAAWFLQRPCGSPRAQFAKRCAIFRQLHGLPTKFYSSSSLVQFPGGAGDKVDKTYMTHKIKSFYTLLKAKLRVTKVAYCCFSMRQNPDITFLRSKTAESQLKKVIYGLSLHSSVFYPATLGTLSFGWELENKKLSWRSLNSFKAEMLKSCMIWIMIRIILHRSEHDPKLQGHVSSEACQFASDEWASLECQKNNIWRCYNHYKSHHMHTYV
jgi:hypothetical protein